MGISGTIAVAYGCGSGADCGDGTVEKDGQCVATTANGGSAGTSMASTGGSGGASGTPPTFAGVVSISPASTTSVVLAWEPASDDKTAADEIRYAVYLASAPGKEHFQSPDAIVPKGGTSYLATGLDASQPIYAVVRAIDAEGNQEDNDVEKKGTPRDDTTAPAFAGAKDASPKAGGKITVSWAAAKDDLSATGAISYRVWVSDASPVDTTGAPAMVTVPGATSAELSLPIPTTTYKFVVHAVDAAGNSDANKVEVSSKPGHDGTAPTFGGCKMASAVDAGDVALTWDAGDDDTTPAAQLAYTAYAFETSSQNHDFTKAAAQQTFVGTLGGTVGGLKADTTYYFVCRAADLSGNEDANDREVHAKTPADTEPPTFDGATAADLVVGMETTQVTLTWNAASDDQTAPADMKYDVYQATTPNGETFTTPSKTVTGVTSATLTVAPGTAFYWKVRARDLAGNQNTSADVEVNATTNVSFQQNIQAQIFNVAVCTNCHTALHAPKNRPYFDDGAAYTELMTYDPNAVKPGMHDQSVLWQYTEWTGPTCPTMPLNDCNHKLSQQQITWIANWIDQGALNN